MSTDFYSLQILPYAPIIIKICRAYTDSQQDFEDYYQEVCLQIWKSRDHFKGNSKWSTWIYRISLNVCLTLVKKKKRYHSLPADDRIEENTQPANFSDQDLVMLYKAIKKLSEIDRAVILLYLEEKSYQEISEVIGSNPNNIGIRIMRIKKRLKKIMNGKIN